MAIRLNFDSVMELCGKSRQAMVYGFQHCRYTQVGEALKTQASPLKQVFDCSIGNPFAPARALTTLEGHKIKQIRIPNLDRRDVVRELKQYCKAGLVNITMENVKRAQAGLPLIPVLFVVDIEGNKHPLAPETVASKKNTFVTMGELRRAYKLCNDPGLHPSVRAVAQETFKFVKVVHEEVGDETVYSVVPIAPFWTDPNWDKEWEKRKAESDKNPPLIRGFWRNQLNKLIIPSRSQNCCGIT